MEHHPTFFNTESRAFCDFPSRVREQERASVPKPGPPSGRDEISVLSTHHRVRKRARSRPDQKLMIVAHLSSSRIATFAKEAIHATHVSCIPYDRACNSRRSGCGPCAGPAADVRHHEGP